MLFESVGQGWIFLLVFVVGAWFCVIGFLFCKACCKLFSKFKYLFAKKHKNKKIKISLGKKHKKSFDMVNVGYIMAYFGAVLVAGIVLYICIYIFDYGQLRWYHILGFCVGFCLSHIFIKKLITKNARHATIGSGSEIKYEKS